MSKSLTDPTPPTPFQRVFAYDDLVGAARDAAGPEAVEIADAAERARDAAYAELRKASYAISNVPGADIASRKLASKALRASARAFTYADAAFDAVKIAPFTLRWVPKVLDFDTGDDLVPPGESAMLYNLERKNDRAIKALPFRSEWISVDSTCADHFEIQAITIGNRRQPPAGHFLPRAAPCSTLVDATPMTVELCSPYMDYVIIVGNTSSEPRAFRCWVRGMTVKVVRTPHEPGMLGASDAAATRL